MRGGVQGRAVRSRHGARLSSVAAELSKSTRARAVLGSFACPLLDPTAVQWTESEPVVK
jgi:hypothetical protein